MKIKHYLLIGISLLGFVSCSETDETDPEFDNWQNRNETYFQQHYEQYLQEYKSKGYACHPLLVDAW